VAAPFAKLTVNGTIGFPNGTAPMLFVYQSGTANPQKPLIVHSPSFTGYGLFYQDDGDRMSFKSSAEDATPSLVVDLDSNWVAIANPLPKPGYELAVNGQIVCEELLVQDSALWPDYVFASDYPLRTVDELDAHVRKHRFLPGVPSAEEVRKNGLDVADMQRRMMEKIEELTLYVIDQHKRLASQDASIAELEQSVSRLKELLRDRVSEEAGAQDD
jgi:hypothetical protein